MLKRRRPCFSGRRTASSKDLHVPGLRQRSPTSTEVTIIPRAAYFTYADLPNIPTVDRDPTLCSLSVPLGVYRSGKTRTRNPDTALGVSPPPPSQASAGPSGSAIRSGSGDRMLAPPQSDRNPRPAAPRAAEDERMIQMLNSRPI